MCTMFTIRTLFFILIVWTVSTATPIKNGESIGKVQKANGKLHVTNKDKYPFVVYIKASVLKEGGKRRSSYCAGVIVAENAILTAGHCLYGKVNPTIIVRAGVLDVNHEKGKKIKVKEYLIHPKYKNECRISRYRYCYEINDIAILWLKEKFTMGTYIQRAKINKNILQPVNQMGWILGWGLDNTNKLSSMLQRGEVQVISTEKCDRYNPTVHVTNQVLCLKPGSKGAQSTEGDSGGPFEIDGVVYGISSYSLYKEPYWTEEIAVYTDLVQYSDWIDNNLRARPTSENPIYSPSATNKRE